MSIPGFTAEAAVYARGRIYVDGGFVAFNSESQVVPQAHTCSGQYCDCKGAADCSTMINKACGSWTRCVADKSGVIRCICEPRVSAG